jgi:hypothetical protein
MDGVRHLHVKQNEQVSDKYHVLYNMHNLELLHECAGGFFEVESTGKGIEKAIP